MQGTKGVSAALSAALVFGAATPFSKRLGAGVEPQLFAGLLYLGSGLVLGATLVLRPSGEKEAGLQRSDRLPLLLVVVFGGMAGPLLLMIGLRTTAAATASLLLNLEAVFTALGAWIIAKEPTDRRIVLGMVAVVVAAGLLSIEPKGGFTVTAGALAIAGSCLCWAVDNVATRPLSLRDPRQVACVKGLVAGSANLVIGLGAGGRLPSTPRLLGALLVGFVGFGLSLVLYVRAVRDLGTARTGAYFAAAPFVGSAIAIVWLREPVGRFFVPAVVLMLVGLALHFSEHHEHGHVHQPTQHNHRHDHADPHHAHGEGGVGRVAQGTEPPAGLPHAAEHRHEVTDHLHGHTPDEHHQHGH
jgi:drug/metabolite transporter (DMT)-like permease